MSHIAINEDLLSSLVSYVSTYDKISILSQVNWPFRDLIHSARSWLNVKEIRIFADSHPTSKMRLVQEKAVSMSSTILYFHLHVGYAKTKSQTIELRRKQNTKLAAWILERCTQVHSIVLDTSLLTEDLSRMLLRAAKKLVYLEKLTIVINGCQVYYRWYKFLSKLAGITPFQGKSSRKFGDYLSVNVHQGGQLSSEEKDILKMNSALSTAFRYSQPVKLGVDRIEEKLGWPYINNVLDRARIYHRDSDNNGYCLSIYSKTGVGRHEDKLLPYKKRAPNAITLIQLMDPQTDYFLGEFRSLIGTVHFGLGGSHILGESNEDYTAESMLDLFLLTRFSFEVLPNVREVSFSVTDDDAPSCIDFEMNYFVKCVNFALWTMTHKVKRSVTLSFGRCLRFRQSLTKSEQIDEITKQLGSFPEAEAGILDLSVDQNENQDHDQPPPQKKQKTDEMSSELIARTDPTIRMMPLVTVEARLKHKEQDSTLVINFDL